MMLAASIGSEELLELAEQRVTRQARLSPLGLPRLAALLQPLSADDQDDLKVRLGFQPSGGRFPAIGLQVTGSLALVCQRCMQPVWWRVDIEASLIVVQDDAELDEMADPFDCIVAGQQGVAMVSIVEDEILASLPLSPMHAQGTKECRAGRRLVSGSGAGIDVDTDLRTRPFADLASLMGQRGGKQQKN